MRRTTRREAGAGRARRQREVIRDVMLSAGRCATWLTLDELANMTRYPPASISAQLRHLRKPQFGAFAVIKRSRRVNVEMRGEGFGTLWEYSVAQERRIGKQASGDAERRLRGERGSVEHAVRGGSAARMGSVNLLEG